LRHPAQKAMTIKEEGGVLFAGTSSGQTSLFLSYIFPGIIRFSGGGRWEWLGYKQDTPKWKKICKLKIEKVAYLNWI